MKNARESNNFWPLSTRKTLGRVLITPSARNAIFLVPGAVWNHLGIISRLVNHRKKKLLQIVTKIAGGVREGLMKLASSPLKMSKLMHAL